MRRLAAAALAAAALAAGCSGGHPSRSAVAPASTTTTTPVSTAPATTAPSTTVAGVPRCATSGLSVSLGPPSGAAGTVYYQLTFRNTSASTCTLAGYAGVSFLDTAGHQIGEAAQRSPIGGPPSTVAVAAGGAGYAALGVVDPGVANCTPATASGVRVYPPGQTAAAEISTAAIMICGSGRPPATIGPVLSQPFG